MDVAVLSQSKVTKTDN